jgi:EH domain-containing protein 1
MGTTEAVAPDAPPPQPKEEEEDYLSEETHAEMFEHFDKEYFFGELKKLYKRRMLPLELASRFGHFASVPMGPADFDAKPMVLLLGQYSVGKTSFIRSLLGRDFPGIRIGPEPTTDRFLAVMRADDQDRVVPGNALAMRHDKPFAGLQGFGNAFLEKLQGAEVYGCPILDNVTLVDTPGVLSGAKQRLGRDYDFPQVVRWFAERSDMIVVMFDAHKLDISDELKATVDALRPHAQKLRVVLNKADQVTPQQLLRVYGALMWQLGRVVSTPEVVRVHLGSFWDRPLDHRRGSDTALLSRERDDLLDELRNLPKNAVLRRINELSRRARKLKVHCYLIHYLRKQMPQFFGKEEKQQKLLADLPRQFAKCANRYGLTRGDFPDVDDFREALLEIDDLSKFPKLDKSKVAEMDRMFATDIPQLLEKAMAARR